MKTSSSSDILPYSRDPNVLFYNEDNNKEMLTVKKRYKNVYLKVALSLELPAHTLLYEAVVDWYNTHIKVFMDADDALNNIPIFEGAFRVLCKPRDTLVYVREAFQFLSRGHSIHNPACICPFQTPSDGRIEELGLPSLCSSDALCPLNTHRHRRTTRDIAMELGISDIRGLVQVSSSSSSSSSTPSSSSLLSMPLLDVLVNLAGFSIDDEDGDYVSCFLCCGPTKINSAQTILDAAKAMFPKSFLLDCRSDDCETKSLKDDLKMLQMRSLVRAVGGPYPNTFSVFYMDKTTEDLAIQVDDDIKSAWKNVTESLCKFFNGPSQESVEKMLLDENIQPMRVQQATSSYNNDSVKIKQPSPLFKKKRK